VRRLSTHYVPIDLPAGTDRIAVKVSVLSGRAAVAMIVGGPKGRRIRAARAEAASPAFSASLRTRKERRRVLLIVTSGHEAGASYRITVRAS
jgi:hypothetical protein